MQIELSTGETVEMMEPIDITSGKRKKLFKDMDVKEGTDVSPGAALSMADILLAHFIVSWSLEAPLPTPAQIKAGNTEALDDLRTVDYDKLALAASGIIKGITPDFEPNPDPKATTESLPA